jgi:hypothetical protein
MFFWTVTGVVGVLAGVLFGAAVRFAVSSGRRPAVAVPPGVVWPLADSAAAQPARESRSAAPPPAGVTILEGRRISYGAR